MPVSHEFNARKVPEGKQTVGMSLGRITKIKGECVENKKFATFAPKNMQHRIFLGLESVAGFLRFGFALL